MGGRIARRLADRGVEQRLLLRDPSRAPSLAGASTARIGGYDDGEGLRSALDGADTLMFIPAQEDRDRMALHRSVVDAAASAGVARIVYLSFAGTTPDHVFTFGRDHFNTEELVRASGARWTFPRMNLYADFLPMLRGADGVIRGPAGDGRVAAVARDDLADACAAILLGHGHDGQRYELSGPDALTLHEAAAVISRVLGEDVRYEPETLDEARASRAGLGEPWEVEGWIGSYRAIADGLVAEVTDGVERLTGHPPIALEEVLRRERA
jgi:uncharacterized protein YbjT (DUF2867 family)